MVWMLFWYSGNIYHNSWTVFLKLSFPYVLKKWTAMRSIALLIYFIFNTLVFSMLLCFNTLIFLCCFVLGWVPFLLSSSISNLNCHTLHHKHLNTDLWPSLSYSIYIGNSYRIYGMGISICKINISPWISSVLSELVPLDCSFFEGILILITWQFFWLYAVAIQVWSAFG